MNNHAKKRLAERAPHCNENDVQSSVRGYMLNPSEQGNVDAYEKIGGGTALLRYIPPSGPHIFPMVCLGDDNVVTIYTREYAKRVKHKNKRIKKTGRVTWFKKTRKLTRL